MIEIDPAHADAIDWLIRLRAGNVADWEAFTTWLEDDPQHARSYDAVAIADAELLDTSQEAVGRYTAANDDVAPRWRSTKWRLGAAGFGAVAAASLAAIILNPSLISSQDRFMVTTVAGERRTIVIADGTHITLNGSTNLTLDRSDMRFAQLESGEALFTIKHDPRRPFSLDVGDDRIQDVGTVFNVIKRTNSTSIEVAEGSVLFNPDRTAIPLEAGQTLHETATTGVVIVGRKPPALIGAWRENRLAYLNAPLATVAEDLSRTTGIAILVDQAVAARQFSGVIQIERDPKILAARLSSLLGVDVRANGKGWIIGKRGRAAR